MDTQVQQLPAEAYISQEWFDQEMEAIFSNTWQFAGFVEELDEPKKYLTVQAGNNNLIVLNNKKEGLKAYHNICRHRGMRLLEGKGCLKGGITCPYHDWTYKLNGELAGMPARKEEFPQLADKLSMCKLNLIEASVGVFKGMIFVHPDKDTKPLKEWFGEVEKHLGPHRVEELVEYSEKDGGGVYAKEVKANWKIIVENYIDGYHLAYLHKHSLYMYDHQRIKSGYVGDHFWFYEPLAQEYQNQLEQASAYPVIDHVPKSKQGAYVPWLFPNLGLAESENSWSTFHLTPIAPDRTLIVSRTKMMNVSEEAYTTQLAKSAQTDYWNKYPATGHGALEANDFMEEDIYVCEQLQQSMKSGYYSVGTFAEKGEKPIVEFHKVLRRWME